MNGTIVQWGKKQTWEPNLLYKKNNTSQDTFSSSKPKLEHKSLVLSFYQVKPHEIAQNRFLRKGVWERKNKMSTR